MKGIILIFVIQAIFINTLRYPYTQNNQLLGQLSIASVDELVLILTKLEEYKPIYAITGLSPQEKYNAGRSILLKQIMTIISNQSIDEITFNDDVLNENEEQNVIDTINNSKWYQKVAWVLNADYYSLKNSLRSPQIGGISNYVNYMNNEQLDKVLFELLEKEPQLKDDYVLFENEIMNRKSIPDDNADPEALIKFIKSHNIETLNEWSARIYTYVSVKIFRCEDIKTAMTITRTDQAFLYINKYLSSAGIDKDMDMFYKIIVYNNHYYPQLKKYYETLTSAQIQQVSFNAEVYHRKNTGETKSFNDLKNYIKSISDKYLIDYIIKETECFPELNEINRLTDFSKITQIASLTTVNNFLAYQDRNDILRWSLNIYDEIKRMDNSDWKPTNSMHDYLYSLSTEEVRYDLINLLKGKNIDYTVEQISHISDMKNNSTLYFNWLITLFPVTIHKKWLNRLQEYHKSHSNAAISIEYSNSSTVYLELFRYIYSYQMNLNTFREYIDNPQDNYTMAYGNYALYFYSIRLEQLVIWLNKVEQYRRKKSAFNGIIGGTKSWDNISKMFKKETQKVKKEKIIFSLLTYIDQCPELKNIEVFDEVIGMRNIHGKFHESTIEQLREYALGLRKYHDMKMVTMQSNESNENEIKHFIKIANESHLKLYIFRIMAMLPELNIESIWNKAVALGKDDLPEIIDHDTIFNYLNKYIGQRDILILYCEQCTRYINAKDRKYTFDNAKCNNLLEVDLVWYISSIVTDKTNSILQTNINFFRLVTGSEEIIYGGLEPYITRQPNGSLDKIIDGIPDKYLGIEEKILLKQSEREKKIERLMQLIYSEKELDNPKLLDDSIDASIKYPQLFSLSKEKLMDYALVAEKHLIDNHSTQNNHDIELISDKYNQLSKNELIWFIASSSLTIENMEIESRNVLLTIGETNSTYLL